MEQWKTSDMDAFQIETENWLYYYAVQSALDGKGDHYYKVHKGIDNRMEEISENEIIDIVQNEKEKVLHKCPCLTIRHGHIVPVVQKSNGNSKNKMDFF